MDSARIKKRRLGIYTPVDATEGSDCTGTTVRDCADLHVVAETLQCAYQHVCIPCAYKVATFDVALDSEICQNVPNQRPELCPRSQVISIATSIKNGHEPPLGYIPPMTVLTVGDGDFSFSVALARFGCHVVATSYESEETVRAVYASVGVSEHLKELESLNAKVFYNVDATKIESTLPNRCSFHRIIWNFPCSAVAKGQDGQNIEMDHNKRLVQAFVENAKSRCLPGGQIHINHKTKPPFNQWKIDEVAVTNIDNVRFLYRVVLDRLLFRPYIPRKALDRKSFPCHDACTYIFEVTGPCTKRNDPTFREDQPLVLSDFSELQCIAPSQLIRVTPHLIQKLRGELLQRQRQRQSMTTEKKKRKS